METELDVCKAVCAQLPSKCYQVSSLIVQSERGGGSDGKGGTLSLPLSSMHNFVNKLIRDGFYDECQNKPKLRAAMEAVIPGSTASISDTDFTIR